MEELADPNQAIRIQERADVRIRSTAIGEIVKPLFDITPLVEERDWKEEDIAPLRQVFVQSAPLWHQNVFPSYAEHILIASLYADEIAKSLNDPSINPAEAQALGLMHDFGKLVIPHEYLRTDIFENLWLKKLRVRPDQLGKFYNISGVLGISILGSNVVNSVYQMSNWQIIEDVADNLGKRNADGSMFTIEQFQKHASGQPKRYAGGVWPSQRRGLKALAPIEDGGQNKQFETIQLTIDEIETLKKKGVNLETVKQRVEQRFLEPENQKFLYAMWDGQESLDPQTDEKLKRPSIETVVLDIGGVLWHDADPGLIEGLSRHFSVTPEQVNQAFKDLVPTGQAGELSEQEFLQKFYEYMGTQCPSDLDLARSPFEQRDIYRVMEGMPEIVQQLAENPDLDLWVYSGIIPPLTKVAYEELLKAYPMLDSDKILFSCDQKAPKTDSSGKGYKVVLNKIAQSKEGGTIDPSSVLFIDDKQDYTTRARATQNARGLTFRGNQFKNQSAAERTTQELQKAGLIKSA